MGGIINSLYIYTTFNTRQKDILLTKKIAWKNIEVKLIIVSKGRLQPVKQVANDRHDRVHGLSLPASLCPFIDGLVTLVQCHVSLIHWEHCVRLFTSHLAVGILLGSTAIIGGRPHRAKHPSPLSAFVATPYFADVLYG